ncbi:hypothetical protein MMC07_009623 [Pseudocyphellaria aurata]|nr:hypothetical protein [Pseudocyphellaria aurata]
MVNYLRTKSVSNVSHNSENLQVDMYFLSRDEIYQTIKPYRMCFPPQGDFPQSNITREKHSVDIKTMRDKESRLNFDDCGFGIMHFDSKMRYEDFEDRARINSVYAEEVGQALKSRLKATHVRVLDFAVRRRHPTFPISTGEEYKHTQPAAMVHIDFTLNEAEAMIRKLYGARAEELLAQHWQLVNVWRPLKGPVRDWPLALCDARSVDYERDTMSSDVVFRDRLAENVQIHHNPQQRWYYLPDQLPTEALIFKTVDSKPDCNFGRGDFLEQNMTFNRRRFDRSILLACPHSSFFNPEATANDPPRESIDYRTFVFYADIACMPPEVGGPF